MDKTCLSLLNLLQETADAKREGAGKGELKRLLTQAALEIVKLRQSARQQVDAVEQSKAATAESKQEVDLSNLQLQNLLYEKNYYNKEIASCQNFKSKYTEEEIGLVSEKQFREEAPQRFQEGIEDAHKLQLQRLEYEKHMRLELLKDLEKVKQRKAEHNQVVIGKRKRLEEVRKQVAGLKEGTAPLRAELSLAPAVSEREALAAASAMLPLPLYILFHQLAAVKQVFGEAVDVEITGSDKEAEIWAQASGAEIFERAEQDVPPAKKRRKSGGDSRPEAVEPEYVAHPLSVKASLGGVGSKPMQLHFIYLPQLEVVTVKASEPEHQVALAALFPEDSGAALPNETPAQRSAAGKFDYDASRLDRPFLWAQHLAGMDFLPALSQTGGLAAPGGRATVAEGMVAYRKQQRVREVLRRIRKAVPAMEHTAANTTTIAAVGGRSAPEASPVKRIRTWEEIVKERAQLAAANGAAVEKPGTAAAAAEAESEEEGALPEEGELPNVK